LPCGRLDSLHDWQEKTEGILVTTMGKSWGCFL